MITSNAPMVAGGVLQKACVLVSRIATFANYTSDNAERYEALQTGGIAILGRNHGGWESVRADVDAVAILTRGPAANVRSVPKPLPPWVRVGFDYGVGGDPSCRDAHPYAARQSCWAPGGSSYTV